MKRLLFCLIALTFSISATASHIISANIYWEHIAGNQFVFTLEITRDCSGISAPTSAIINGPFGFIACNQATSSYVSTSFCTSSSVTSCNNGNGAQLATYISDTISLNGTPPPTGWEFSWSTCCRPNIENTNASGIYTRSIMYPYSNNGVSGIPAVSTLSSLEIPSFIFTPAGGKYSYNSQPQPDVDVDFIQTTMSTPLDAANSPISWSGGFSNTSPLPTAAQNPNNGPFILDAQSGVVFFENYNVSEGLYIYTVDHNYYLDGQLVARVEKNMAHYLQNDTSANTQPQITISQNGQNTAFNQTPLNYSLLPGDSLELIITAKDIGQFVRAESYGAILNTSRHGNVPNFNHATVQSLMSGNSFTGNDSVQLKLRFTPDVNNAVYLPNPARVILTFSDTLCSGPKQVAVPILIHTTPALQISNQLNALELCSGSQDSLSAEAFPSGSYWSPGNFVSDSTAADVQIDAQANGWLYLKNPNYPNFYDSLVIIRLDTLGFYLQKTNNMVELVDNYNTPAQNWFYEGFPVGPTNQTLDIFANGNYSVSGAASSNCTLTDIEKVSDIDYSYNNIPTAPLSIRKGTLPWANGFTFALNLPFNNNLREVTLLGVEDQAGLTRTSEVYLSIFDENDVNICNRFQSVVNPKGEPITFSVNIMTEGYKNYRLLISSDNNLIFNSLKDVSLPHYGKQNGDFVVKDMIQASSHTSSRTISDTIMPAVAMKFDYNVGLQEESLSALYVYPNPASDKISISEGLSEKSQVKIFSLSGQPVQDFILPKGQTEININALAPGAYYLKIKQNAYKFIKN